MKTPLFYLLGLLVILFTGCLLQPVEVVRDLQAVWADDDSAVLIAQSRYWTRRPSEDYFYAPSGYDWTISYYLAKDPDDLSNRKLLLEVEDDIRDGYPQYSPLYYFADKQLLVVAESRMMHFYDTATWERTDITADGDIAQYFDPILNITPDNFNESNLAIELLPSPDGSTLAVLWQAAYALEASLLLQFNLVVSFYSLEPYSYLYSRRVTESPDIADSGNWSLDYNALSVIPYPYTRTDAMYHIRLIWGADPSGVYVLYSDDEADKGGYTYFVAFDNDGRPAPVQASMVPEYPVPTSSGPVSDDGMGFQLVVQDNATRIETFTNAAWVPFEEVGTVDVSQVDYDEVWDLPAPSVP